MKPIKKPQMMLGLATSRDGLSWIRHAGNPLYRRHWVEDMMIVKRGDTYYMFAEGLNDQAQLLTSRDGLDWQRVGPLDVRTTNGQPIAAGPYGTPTAWFEGGTWHLFYERGDQGVWLARSTDLQVWTNAQDDPVLSIGPEPYDKLMIALNQIVKHDGRYYALFHGSGTAQKPRLWTTNIAVSQDLIHWKKYPGNPLLPERDNKSSGILVHDGKQFRLYTMHPEVHVHFPPRPAINPRRLAASNDASKQLQLPRSGNRRPELTGIQVRQALESHALREHAEHLADLIGDFSVASHPLAPRRNAHFSVAALLETLLDPLGLQRLRPVQPFAKDRLHSQGSRRKTYPADLEPASLAASRIARISEIVQTGNHGSHHPPPERRPYPPACGQLTVVLRECSCAAPSYGPIRDRASVTDKNTCTSRRLASSRSRSRSHLPTSAFFVMMPTGCRHSSATSRQPLVSRNFLSAG